MKTIIAGSRGVTDSGLLEIAIERCGWEISSVVSGGARGADALGERWAAARSLPVEVFPADWNLHGKSAGYRRNEQMAKNAEALVALWDGVSRGTKHMIDLARKHNLRVHVELLDLV